MGVRLPETHIDARNLLTEVLDTSSILILRDYNCEFTKLGKIIHSHVEKLDSSREDDKTTLALSLTYETLDKKGDDFVSKETVKKLALLNTINDFKWKRSLIYKIWGGNYPSTVAIDINDGTVYFIHIHKGDDVKIELVYFGILNENEFELVKHDIDDSKPYKIKISDDAMFDYITGDEGLNHLRNNIVIELNCGMPLVIRKGE